MKLPKSCKNDCHKDTHVYYPSRSNGNVTLTFNHQARAVPVREARSSTYDAHALQPGALVPFPMAAAAAAANYQPLPSPAANHVVVQQAPPPPPQPHGVPHAPPPHAPPQLQQQYVPVTMVDTQNGRQMLAAVQASWPTASSVSRQMTLVPSWPAQLSAAAAAAPNASAAAAQAAADNILQPLFAAAASDAAAADWHRRPLLVDSAGGIHSLQAADQAVFPAVVYDRVAAAAAASTSSAGRAAAVAAAAAAASYQPAAANNKRSTKTTNNSSSTAGQQPPPAHSNSHSYSNINYGVKKEPTQLSPVKKRIKENKDHYYVADSAYHSHHPHHQRPSPVVEAGYRAAGRTGAITIHDTPPLCPPAKTPEVSRQ